MTNTRYLTDFGGSVNEPTVHHDPACPEVTTAGRMRATTDDETETHWPRCDHCTDDPWRYRCPECRCLVTRGRSGLEYGHARRPTNNHGGDSRCSRRPAAVDPNKPFGRERIHTAESVEVADDA